MPLSDELRSSPKVERGDLSRLIADEYDKFQKYGLQRYIGPHAYQGLRNIAGLLNFVGPQADVLGATQASADVMRDIQAGDYSSALANTGLMGAELADYVVPGNLTALAGMGSAKLITSQSDDILNLSKIMVPETERGQGVAQKAMSDLLRKADEQGMTVALTPSADFGANKSRLTKWYKSLGFVPNKGRNKRFETMESMVRPPKD